MGSWEWHRAFRLYGTPPSNHYVVTSRLNTHTHTRKIPTTKSVWILTSRRDCSRTPRERWIPFIVDRLPLYGRRNLFRPLWGRDDSTNPKMQYNDTDRMRELYRCNNTTNIQLVINPTRIQIITHEKLWYELLASKDDQNSWPSDGHEIAHG